MVFLNGKSVPLQKPDSNFFGKRNRQYMNELKKSRQETTEGFLGTSKNFTGQNFFSKSSLLTKNQFGEGRFYYAGKMANREKTRKN